MNTPDSVYEGTRTHKHGETGPFYTWVDDIDVLPGPHAPHCQPTDQTSELSHNQVGANIG